jgi:hypothetical protein
MERFDWQSFLREFSQQLADDDRIRDVLSETELESGWLGRDGASPQQIAQLERRLGAQLPPSYKNFLQASNGFGPTGLDSVTPPNLWPLDTVAWFRDRHNDDWISPWRAAEANTGILRVPDQQYFVYGPTQVPTAIRSEYLASALEVSDVGDGGVYLLNPEVRFADGEWEAWHLAAWLPGASRYRSFREMMEAIRSRFLEVTR